MTHSTLGGCEGNPLPRVAPALAPVSRSGKRGELRAVGQARTSKSHYSQQNGPANRFSVAGDGDAMSQSFGTPRLSPVRLAPSLSLLPRLAPSLSPSCRDSPRILFPDGAASESRPQVGHGMALVGFCRIRATWFGKLALPVSTSVWAKATLNDVASGIQRVPGCANAGRATARAFLRERGRSLPERIKKSVKTRCWGCCSLRRIPKSTRLYTPWLPQTSHPHALRTAPRWWPLRLARLPPLRPVRLARPPTPKSFLAPLCRRAPLLRRPEAQAAAR